MKKKLLVFALACLMWGVALPERVEAASPVVRTLKIVVGAVRYGRHKIALRYFAGQAQGELLLEKNWKKASVKQRKEFVSLFQTLFAKIALRRVESRFKYLKTIVYDKPQVKGNKAMVNSTIVILHALKKQEMKLKYELRKVGKKWKVLDVTTIGDSMLTGIRNNQIRKIMKKGGWSRLLTLMRKRAAQLKKIKLK